MIRRTLSAAAVSILLLGCDAADPTADPGDPDALTRDEFIEVYIELRRAAEAVETPEEFEDRKREILERRGITADQLLGFSETWGVDVEELATLWDTIRSRLSRPDTATAQPDG